MTTEAAVLFSDTDTGTKVGPDLKHTCNKLNSKNICPHYVKMWNPSLNSPGPPDEHLEDFRFSGSGPQQPGVSSIFVRAPVVRAVPVEDVVAVEALQRADLLQLVVLRVIVDVESPQRRLLQDNTGRRTE